MQVSREYIQNFANQLGALGDSAKKNLVSQLSGIDIDNYDDVAGVMRFVCAPYTDMSAAITADFYNGIRNSSNAKGNYQAEAVSGYDAEEVTRASYAISKEVSEGRNVVPIEALLEDLTDRQIKNASDECIRQNSRRDPARPRYASVPTSSTPCAWCVMRASQGYVYYDEKSVTHSHHACKCIAVPSFGGMEIEGYDPDEYFEQYKEARDEAGTTDTKEVLSEMRKIHGMS